MRRAPGTPTPQTIDEYLALVSDEKRPALEKLRQAIRSAAPTVEECISYQMPAFRHNGKVIVWFGAAAKHCSFYPGAFPIEQHGAALARYETSKGTIRFSADDPLPTSLVRKLVKSRLAEADATARQPVARSAKVGDIGKVEYRERRLR